MTFCLAIRELGRAFASFHVLDVVLEVFVAHQALGEAAIMLEFYRLAINEFGEGHRVIVLGMNWRPDAQFPVRRSLGLYGRERNARNLV